MKKLLLCFALCAFAFVFSSCEEQAPVETPGDNNEQTPGDENGGNTGAPTIEFQITSENPMEFTAEGGACVIKYAITNPDATLSVTATSEAKWIAQDDEATKEENTLYFVVAKNETEESRTATIVVTYDRDYEIVINQAAAEVAPKPELDYSIIILSDNPVHYTAEGGTCKIYYDIENPKIGVYFIDSYSTVEWIENDFYAGEGDFSYTVKANTASEPRTGKVVLTYGEAVAEVVIYQDGKETPAPTPTPDPSDAIVLPYMSGIYFSNQYGATEYDYNYNIVLSNMQNCVDIITGEQYVYAGYQYLCLDLYSSIPSENYNISFTLPDGLYLFDKDNTCEAGTISAKYSFFYDATGEGTEVFFTDGSVTVENGTIYCTLKGEDGKMYVFSSDDTDVDNSELFTSDGYYLSTTLTGDLHIPFENPNMKGTCNYDWYVVGRNLWYVELKDNSEVYHSLQLELLVPFEDAIPEGEFLVSTDLNLEQMALPGFLNSYHDVTWSWYFTDEDHANIREGKVVFTKNNDGTHTVSLDFVDDEGHKITGECTTYFSTYGYLPLSSCIVNTALPSRK